MKRALLVGINDYPGTQNDLQGCVNDVTNVYDVLVKHFEFPPAEVRILTDGRARTEAVLDELTRLIGKSSAGDSLVFHFSGHGSQVRDLDGDELKDHKDEILCPQDCDWERKLIRDDDLARIFKELPAGVALEVILDSCHSGTGTREALFDRLEAGPAYGRTFGPAGGGQAPLRQRFLRPPADVSLRADEVFGEEVPLLRIGTKMNHILWAACRSGQYSADAFIQGRPSGAFTYFFCKHLRDSQGKIPRSELLKRVRASLRFEGFSQVPQLEGPAKLKDRPVFS